MLILLQVITVDIVAFIATARKCNLKPHDFYTEYCT